METLQHLPLVKDFLIKMCATDHFDVDVLTLHLKSDGDLCGNMVALKTTVHQLIKLFKNIADDAKEDLMTCSDGGGPCLVKSEIHDDLTMTAQSAAGTDSNGCQSSASDRTISDSKSPNDCKQLVVDPQFVFLTRSKHEIEEKIAKYIATKQNDNNEMNIREFCGMQPSESNGTETCARTSAVFHPRAGHSHLVVQKVVNRCGPQVKTKPLPQKLTEAQFSCSASTQQSEVQKAASGETLLPPGVEERISNMERHVKLYNGNKPVPRDVYQRLQQLESRIMYLESVSPEYFEYTSTSSDGRKKPKVEPREITSDEIRMYKNLSASEVDRKISQLKQQLNRRALELQTLEAK